MKDKRTYSTWLGMVQRCGNPNNPRYADYGGRGIQVEDCWKDYQIFLRDMGLRPAGKQLDRINNDLGYYKDNCKWSTREDQQRNTRRSVLTKEMVTQILQEKSAHTCSIRALSRKLAVELGVCSETIREVLKQRTWKV